MIDLEDEITKLLGITDLSLTAILQEIAERDFLARTNLAEIDPDAHGWLILQMFIYKYNTYKNIGLNSQSANGISENYSADYPTSILASLRRFRKLKVI